MSVTANCCSIPLWLAIAVPPGDGRPQDPAHGGPSSAACYVSRCNERAPVRQRQFGRAPSESVSQSLGWSAPSGDGANSQSAPPPLSGHSVPRQHFLPCALYPSTSHVPAVQATHTHSLAVFRPLRPLKLGDGPILKFLMRSMPTSLLSSRLSPLYALPFSDACSFPLEAPVRDVVDF